MCALDCIIFDSLGGNSVPSAINGGWNCLTGLVGQPVGFPARPDLKCTNHSKTIIIEKLGQTKRQAI